MEAVMEQETTKLKPYYSDSAVTIYHGDCREIIGQIGEVDHVITDPPYSEKTHKGSRGAGGAVNAALVDFASITEQELIEHCHGWLKIAKRWIVMNCEWRHAAKFEDAGLPVIRVGVWVKPNGAPQFTGDRPGTGWEAVAILHRQGKKRWNRGGHHAVWSCNIEQGGHPTQKPIQLYRNWIADFTDVGEVILDPFAGSGTTGRAAKDLGRKAILIEREEKYCEIAASRMSQEVLI